MESRFPLWSRDGGRKAGEGGVEGDGGGGREVQGTDVVGADGDARPGIGVGGEEGIGESAGFGAEDKGVAGAVGDGVVAAVGGGGEEVQAVGVGGREIGEGGGPVGVDADVDGIPVVEAGAAEVFVVDGKAEGFDEVEDGSGGGAEARDVASVGRDFGMDEDDVERGGGPGDLVVGDAGMVGFHGVIRG